MTYAEAIAYLDSFVNYERLGSYPYREAFGLGRVRELLACLGDPHRLYPSLHVAGTKGKGSTCVFAGSILAAAGLRVGLYTSPHLASFRERIRVNGVPIREEDLARVVEEVRRALPPDGPGPAGRQLTYFEVTTCCAFLHFAREGVDAAVVEVGLGGRLDATNVLAPAVTVITPVSFDHTAQLGDTLEQIAGEKAGIVKPGVPVVMAPQRPEAEGVIRRVADAAGAPLHAVEEEVQAAEIQLALSGTRATLQTPVRAYRELTIPLLGRHQVENCGAAIRAAELMSERQRGWQMTPEAVHRGIAATIWPGRCQLIRGRPAVLLDGAQNEESARTLVETVEALLPGRPVVLVVGCSIEKDLRGMARVWGPWAGQVIATRAAAPRAEPAERVAEEFRPFQPGLRRLEPVSRALEVARDSAGAEGLVVVTGSLFVVAEALEVRGRFSPTLPAPVGCDRIVPRL